MIDKHINLLHFIYIQEQPIPNSIDEPLLINSFLESQEFKYPSINKKHEFSPRLLSESNKKKVKISFDISDRWYYKYKETMNELNKVNLDFLCK